MPKNINWLQVNVYHPLVQRIQELNKSGVQITKSKNKPDKQCALEIAGKEFGYKYWHTLQIYYFIYDETLVKRLLEAGKK